jgi:peptide/nickel transport system ATP-binding protein
MILITHDLSLIAETCDTVAIMYAGKITYRLLRAFPSLRSGRSQLIAIPVDPPELINPPSGCRFHRDVLALRMIAERVNRSSESSGKITM